MNTRADWDHRQASGETCGAVSWAPSALHGRNIAVQHICGRQPDHRGPHTDQPHSGYSWTDEQALTAEQVLGRRRKAPTGPPRSSPLADEMFVPES